MLPLLLLLLLLGQLLESLPRCLVGFSAFALAGRSSPLSGPSAPWACLVLFLLCALVGWHFGLLLTFALPPPPFWSWSTLDCCGRPLFGATHGPIFLLDPETLHIAMLPTVSAPLEGSNIKRAMRVPWYT